VPWTHYPNKNVSSNHQNLLCDKSASFKCDGRLFHSPGPAAANALSPKVLSVRVTMHVQLAVELSRRSRASATRRQSSARYDGKMLGVYETTELEVFSSNSMWHGHTASSVIEHLQLLYPDYGTVFHHNIVAWTSSSCWHLVTCIPYLSQCVGQMESNGICHRVQPGFIHADQNSLHSFVPWNGTGEDSCAMMNSAANSTHLMFILKW